MALKLILADYGNASHASDIIELLNAYAEDPMGGGEPLGNFARDNLVASLAEFPGAFSVLAFADNKAVGLANCFQGFSTFACRPLINIHDLMVLSSARGNSRVTTSLDVRMRNTGLAIIVWVMSTVQLV